MPASKTDCVSARTCELFYLLMTRKRGRGYLQPQNFIQMLRKENEMFRSTTQQDAHEFAMYLLNALVDTERRERGIKDPLVLSPIQELVQGTVVAETCCMACESVVERTEPFICLSLDLEPNCSVARCLDVLSSPEMMTGGDRYMCDVCCGATRARRRMRIRHAPPVLFVQLKRFKYQERQMAFVKSACRVSIPTELRVPLAPPTDNDGGAFAPLPTAADHQPHDGPTPDGAAAPAAATPPSPPCNGVRHSDGAGVGLAVDGAEEAAPLYQLHGMVVHHGHGLNMGHYISYLGVSADPNAATGSGSSPTPSSSSTATSNSAFATPATPAAAATTAAGGSSSSAGSTPLTAGVAGTGTGSKQQWYRFDDETVSPMPERELQYYYGVPPSAEHALTSTAYLLIYQRV